MMNRFVDQNGEVYDMTEVTSPEIKLGRSRECEVVIPPVDSPFRQITPFSDYITVSRVHAILDTETGMIEDADSSRGTYINDIRLPKGTKLLLKDRDTIRLGDLKLVYINHPIPVMD